MGTLQGKSVLQCARCRNLKMIVDRGNRTAGTSAPAGLRVEFTFSCEARLIYVLNESWTARTWIAQLDKMHAKFLRRTDLNHRHGFATLTEIRSALARLTRCAQVLGFPMEKMTARNWQQVLNQLHIRFPEFFKTNFAREKFQVAHEMNLLIHWLEYELHNVYDHKQQYLFHLDFNHFAPAYNLKAKFPEEEFKHFSPVLEFGNLHLHYIYIGRHFLEMFDADDRVCPTSHFRAQHEFNATCGLVFSEPTDVGQLDRDMHAYYLQRGGSDFFGFEYGDPKMARGFFKLGQLEDLQDYSNMEQRQALREKLKSSRITGWRVLPGVTGDVDSHRVENAVHG